jgi:sigma-B regulation protein RsbU (phosphoserine phosphatase)
VFGEIYREAASMKRDLETAREIQFDLVPSEEFRQDGITVRSRMRPANTVGGDYYDVIRLDERKVAVVQGDVAGKGIPAAMLMAVLQGSLRTLVSAGFRGARLVSAINGYLHDNTPSNRMVTLFYGELDTSTGELCYVNAGHNRPFHILRDGGMVRPDAGSMVLGILPDRVYEEATLRLEAGERLLLFTDGINEATDEKDREYGDERVEGFLKRHPSAPAESLVEGLVTDVLGFCKPARPADDMTLTLITRE